MALNRQIQATCLLLLLLTSLTSASVLSRQTTQLADLQTQDTAGAAAGATAGLTPGLQRLRRRDTHFPICIYCCGCCYKSKCGICCKT
ncbi:hepcidin [Hipposideros larvatus]